ncbi:MAG: adenylyltransferase/cytidyltransferase family protein [Oceanidesulfovibrio sp.]
MAEFIHAHTPGHGEVPYHPAVLDRSVLVERIAAHKKTAARVVFTNGCFDILHPGHVDLLARARFLGDILVVGLNTDESVRRLSKGPGRPVVPFEARAYVLAHLISVNYVTGFDEDTPYELIRAVRPHVLVKGGDWPIESIVGADIVESDGGLVVSLPLLKGFSTSALVSNILDNCKT